VRDQGLDVVLHHGSQGLVGPGAVGHPVAELRVPDKIVTAQILAMVLGDVDGDLATCEIEDALFRLGSKEFHVVGRGDFAEDMGVIQNLLVQDVGILACALFAMSDTGLRCLSEVETLPADLSHCRTIAFRQPVPNR
jgi:hypothetical protein